MLKPKNISIKKITEPEPLNEAPKKHTNSRKSIKIPKKQHPHSNQPSPINIMKQDTQNDTHNEHDLDQSESDHGNFIKYINGYLNHLDNDKLDMKGKNNDKNQIQVIRRKIMKEKEINRNMQKNIVEFQRILLHRTQKLDILEDCMRRLQAKENNRNASNLSHHHASQAKSRKKLIKHPLQLQQISSQFQLAPSDYSETQPHDDKYARYQQRRKTQLPTQIQRMISRTMALKPDKFSRPKY